MMHDRDVRSDAMRCLSLFGVRDSSELRTSRKSHDGSHGASLTRMPIQTFVRLCCEFQNRQRLKRNLASFLVFERSAQVDSVVN